MKKILLTFVLLLILAISATAGGCLNHNTDFNLRVIPPQNIALPLQGTWEIVSLLQESAAVNQEPARQWVGKTLHFWKNDVLLGEYLLSNPSCQVKRVEADVYLRCEHQAFPADFSFKNSEIEVITLSDKHLFLCDLLRINNDELLLSLFNNSYMVRKVSDDVDETIFSSSEITDIFEIRSLAGTTSKYTGVLLGLRAPSPEPDRQGYQGDHYRTVWLALEDQKLAPVLETNTIIFPRRRGFYQLEVIRKNEEKKEEDFIIAGDILEEGKKNDTELSLDPFSWEGKEGYIHRRVHYIGNDYVSIEEMVKQASMSDGRIREENRLRMIAVDSLPAMKAVKFSDLAGLGAVGAIEQGKQNLLQKTGLGQAGPKDEENFGLARKMGYWIFNGRLNYLQNNVSVAADYSINVIPPGHVVYYNKLNIPWPRVKNYVPSALDVFTSPHSNLALVVTNNEIIVYGMFQENLTGPPLERIVLKEGEEVIMAEWALGQYYVENWALTFQNYLANQ